MNWLCRLGRIRTVAELELLALGVGGDLLALHEQVRLP